MKTFNQFLTIAAISFLFSIFINPAILNAQSIIGKWQIDGFDAQAHFSKEGVFMLDFPDEDFYSIFKLSNNVLGTIPLNDSENVVLFAVKHINNSTVELKEQDKDEILTLKYLGDAQIPNEMLDYLEPVLDGMGEQTNTYTSDEGQYAAENGYEEEDYSFEDEAENYGNETQETSPETVSYTSNSTSVAGEWTWTGPNGSGTTTYSTDGYVKTRFGNERSIHYGRYSQSGNEVTINYFSQRGTTYSVENRTRSNFDFSILDGSGRSWKYTYQGEPVFTSIDSYNINQAIILQNQVIYGW